MLLLWKEKMISNKKIQMIECEDCDGLCCVLVEVDWESLSVECETCKGTGQVEVK